MVSKKELEDILKELREVGDILGSLIIRKDGLLIISKLSQDVDARNVSAMAAAIVGTAETSANELKIGKFKKVLVDATDGQYVAIGSGKEAFLVCLINKNANIGLVLISMEKASNKISRLLS